MTLATRSGIPTTYGKTRFRSRLEARWAAFFDLVDWSWTYEPLDTGGWIPDFLIHGDAPFLVEIGPCIDRHEFEEKATKPATYQERPTLILGVSPVALADPIPGAPVPHFPAGVIVNEAEGSRGTAYWMWCMPRADSTSEGPTCDGQLVVYGDSMDRPCDHYSGRSGPVVGPWLHDRWAEAGNRVQWRGR